MLPIINGLYLNLQYAEITPQNIPKLVEKSYRPVLKELLKRKNEKFLLAITGRSIEILAQDYPDVLKIIQQLVRNKIIQIVGGTYTNPVLALIPTESKERQITTHLLLLKKYFNYKPLGFCPPEFTWDPTLSETLKKFEFKWSVILQHQIDFSERPNEFATVLINRPEYSANTWAKVMYRSLLRRLLTLPKIQILFNRELNIRDHKPFKILGVNDEIIGIKTVRTWTGFIIAATANKVLQSRYKLQRMLDWQVQNSSGLFFPFFGDLENINFHGNSPIEFPLRNFIAYLDLIKENNKLIYQFPDEYLKSQPANEKIYIKTSSGEPSASLDIWERDPDSMRLENLCVEIRTKLNNLRAGAKRQKVEKLLMLAENADGRGWNPVPERKLACFQAALEALKILL